MDISGILQVQGAVGSGQQSQVTAGNEFFIGQNNANNIVVETDGRDGLSPEVQALRYKLDLTRQKILGELAKADFSNQADLATQEFASMLRQMLRDNDINMGDGISLTMNENGIVNVHGRHESKQYVEAFFLANMEMSDSYADAHLRQEIARAIERSKNSPSNNQNPYARNQMSWERVAINVTPENAKVEFI